MISVIILTFCQFTIQFQNEQDSIKRQLTGAENLVEYAQSFYKWKKKQHDDALATVRNQEVWLGIQCEWELLCRNQLNKPSEEETVPMMAEFSGFLKGRLNCAVPVEFREALIKSEFDKDRKTFKVRRLAKREFKESLTVNISGVSFIAFSSDIAWGKGSVRLVRNGQDVWKRPIWSTSIAMNRAFQNNYVASAVHNKVRKSVVLFFVNGNGFHIFEYRLSDGKRIGTFSSNVWN